ncbi:hypothetical protein [Hymenobacter crusticola]|uniref:hypothetical protein n=1 Tax=Hymenobacter crusticola TaxID=1770526 RepID=UPI0015C50F3C|nr:hypothetical protein [Hymenobacter crusticola]
MASRFLVGESGPDPCRGLRACARRPGGALSRTWPARDGGTYQQHAPLDQARPVK